MPHSSIVIKLLLLLVIAGNIAFVAVDGDVLVDVEAVTEWRIDKDAGDDDLGVEPGGLLALFGFSRESVFFVASSGTLTHHRHTFGAMQASTRTTRAPPFAEQA